MSSHGLLWAEGRCRGRSVIGLLPPPRPKDYLTLAQAFDISLPCGSSALMTRF